MLLYCCDFLAIAPLFIVALYSSGRNAAGRPVIGVCDEPFIGGKYDGAWKIKRINLKKRKVVLGTIVKMLAYKLNIFAGVFV